MSAAPWRGAVASLALTAASLTSVVGPAGADEADEGLAEPTVKMIDADTLRHAAADRQTARTREHVRTNFLTDSANNGRLYDASEVKTAVVDDVTVAWPLGVDVSRVVTATEAATGKVGLAVVASNSPTPADQSTPLTSGCQASCCGSASWPQSGVGCRPSRGRSSARPVLRRCAGTASSRPPCRTG